MAPLPLRDIDSVTRARWIQAFGWAAFPGLFIGVAVAVPLSASAGSWVFVVIPALFTALAGGIAMALGEGVGGVVSAVAHPKGAAVARDYSRVDALVLQGDIAQAMALLRAEADRAPEDPEPRLRLARLLRDELERPDEAVAWFRRARDARGIAPPRAALVDREIVELLLRGNDLPAALTELARLADLHPDSPAGQWAREERPRVKALWMERSVERSAD